MKELEKSDQNSKSLMANVLDLEGDFILAPGGRPIPQHHSKDSNLIWGQGSNPAFTSRNDPNGNVLENELHSILLEMRFITDKIKDDVRFF